MDQSLEQWLPVVGYEGYYEVSDQGRVRSLDRVIMSYRPGGGLCKHRRRGHIKRQALDKNGYKLTTLCRDGVERLCKVHQLVIEAFAGPRPVWATMVNHLDNNPANNYLSNLEWSNNGLNKRHAPSQRKYDYNGQKVSCAELAEIAGISYHTMHTRLKTLGWSVERAVVTPGRGGSGRTTK